MAPDTLEADSIIYRIGDRNLLKNIYLKCQVGEVVGLLGRNGSGKSTLLKIIFGTLETENKSIRINGKRCQRPFTQHLISYLPQESFLPRSLKVRQLISLFLPSREKQEALKEHARIQPLLSKTVHQLSGGQLRYLEVALLLHLDTPFLLLDEPFSGIEPLLKEHMQELILAHKETKGILVTDHNYRHIIDVSDRLILLTEGTCRPIHHLQELEDWEYVPAGIFS
ncbi:ATP-binding cassette domain-containing protein [Rufibacter sediminis]|uniref:ATP-binding cassette domain-containing protein n=1 Tax=Rufibacter sediminis TaxID=2762756 RepID=A0ABR6VV84_9BACT|nr:ATP-binding cassette domain-containing protein [Rufibacter sediminis]MBC3540713.1 ATP-binding cassette domain-containing protein [Rufibacter sediminis]